MIGSRAEFSQEDEEHAANFRVFTLEEFCGGEEDVSGFLSGEGVTSSEKVQNVGHATEALGDTDGDGVEDDSALLEDGAFFNAFEGHRVFLFVVVLLLSGITIFVIH